MDREKSRPKTSSFLKDREIKLFDDSKLDKKSVEKLSEKKDAKPMDDSLKMEGNVDRAVQRKVSIVIKNNYTNKNVGFLSCPIIKRIENVVKFS